MRKQSQCAVNRIHLGGGLLSLVSTVLQSKDLRKCLKVSVRTLTSLSRSLLAAKHPLTSTCYSGGAGHDLSP